MLIARKSILTVFLILLIDQTVKILIKTGMFLYQDIPVFGNWFIIKFIENNGMAFGVDLPGDYGKLVLSVFRIIAIIAIVFYMRHLIREKAPNGLLISMSLILAGAIGNILDSAFYGLIFNESTPFAKSVLFPEGGGYSAFLHGKVVDMFYFPIIQGTWPQWIPFKGGDYFEFFRPVFNLADSAISIGVFSILIFQKKFFVKEEVIAETPAETEAPTSPNPSKGGASEY
jgi:signal peptidase II